MPFVFTKLFVNGFEDPGVPRGGHGPAAQRLVNALEKLLRHSQLDILARGARVPLLFLAHEEPPPAAPRRC